MKKPKIIAIIGSTATGKTALAREIATKYNGELLSVDSRQVYKGMDIGTNKDPVEYGINLVNPDEHYSIGEFKPYAEGIIKEILEKGKVPILVGGTGLWVDAIIDNFSLEEGVPNGELHYEALKIGYQFDREELYTRIDARVDEMMEQGLEEEVKGLMEQYGCEISSMTGIGYRQLCQYFNGEIDREEAIRLIKRDSRHYAKRQVTWFKRDERIQWVKTKEQALKLVQSFLR